MRLGRFGKVNEEDDKASAYQGFAPGAEVDAHLAGPA